MAKWTNPVPGFVQRTPHHAIEMEAIANETNLGSDL